MTAANASKQVKDGAGVIFLQRVVDLSGTGQGPFIPTFLFSSADGSRWLDMEELFGSITSGPSFAASGLTPVTQAFTAEGSTAALAVKAGREALLQVTGSGSADLQVEMMLDGSNWLPVKASDGTTQVLRFQYTGVPFATFLPALPVAGAAFRVTDLAHGSGTVNVRLVQ